MARAGCVEGAPLAKQESAQSLELPGEVVMRGLDPRIHLLREKVLTKIDGLQRTLGLPEVCTIIRCLKSGKPDLRLRPQHLAGLDQHGHHAVRDG
jgi:hypothetical protein